MLGMLVTCTIIQIIISTTHLQWNVISISYPKVPKVRVHVQYSVTKTTFNTIAFDLSPKMCVDWMRNQRGSALKRRQSINK